MNDNNEQVTNDEKIHKINRYYANWVSIESSLFDINLLFGQDISQGNGKIVKEPLAQVFMSPQHAKVFTLMLMQNIKQYEEKFGEIHVPQFEVKMEQDKNGEFDR